LTNEGEICSGSDYVSISVPNPSLDLTYNWQFSPALIPSFGEITGPNNAFSVTSTGNHSITVRAVNNRGCESSAFTQTLQVGEAIQPIDLSIALTAEGSGFIALANQSIDQYFWGRDKCIDLSTEDLPGCNNLQLCFPATGVDLSSYGYWVEAVAQGCRQKQYYYGSDACILELLPLNTKDLEKGKHISVFPNPSYDGRFTLNGLETERLSAFITDNSGRLAEGEILFEEEMIKINLSNLANGIYLLHLKSDVLQPMTYRLVNLSK
jgi:hypothetical protein